MILILIKEYCKFHIFGIAHLLHDSFHMFRKNFQCMHLFERQKRSHYSATQTKSAGKQRLSHGTVLVVCFLIKSFIHNFCEINSFIHQHARHIHRGGRRAGILKHSGIGNHSGIQTFRDFFCDLLRI